MAENTSPVPERCPPSGGLHGEGRLSAPRSNTLATLPACSMPVITTRDGPRSSVLRQLSGIFAGHGAVVRDVAQNARLGEVRRDDVGLAVSSAMRWHMAGVYVPVRAAFVAHDGVHHHDAAGSAELVDEAADDGDLSAEPKSRCRCRGTFRPSLRHCAMCSRMCGVKSCKL